MFAKAQHLQRHLLQSLDGGLYALALIGAYLLRSRVSVGGMPQLESIAKYLWLLPPVWVLGPMLLDNESLYDSRRSWSHASAALRILRSSAFLVLAIILLSFLARVQFARSVILLTGAFGSVTIYVRHEVTAWASSHRERRRTIWIGSPGELRRLRGNMSAQELDSIETIAELSLLEASSTSFAELLHKRSVSLVITSLAEVRPASISPILATCENEGVEFLIQSGIGSSAPGRMTAEVFASEPALVLRAQTADPLHLIAKQAMDYAGSAALLVLLAPLFALIALSIRLFTRGPILFRQERAGLNGRPFTMLKFRTMEADAEARRPSLASQNEMKGPVFKLSRDPRVTRVGRVLRRHGLDELPQLWNVIRGEMSLVGPRPLPLEEVTHFQDDAHRRRLSVRPGLTCLWQINGRNDISDFNDWVRLDLAYIDQWSLWLDLKILAATLPVVILGRGGR